MSSVIKGYDILGKEVDLNTNEGFKQWVFMEIISSDTCLSGWYWIRLVSEHGWRGPYESYVAASTARNLTF